MTNTEGTMTREITSYDDIIDSREIIDRVGELAARWTAAANGDADAEPLDDEERAELDTLSALANDGEQASDDWEYGAALIRDSYFEDYARELAESIGAINSDAKWPNNFIDWEAAAEALLVDYTSVEFEGVTYWLRA